MKKKLSLRDLSELDQCEASIERGQKKFLETCISLRAIREGKLFRTRYPDWDSYCRAKLGSPAEQVDEYIKLAEQSFGNAESDDCPF